MRTLLVIVVALLQVPAETPRLPLSAQRLITLAREARSAAEGSPNRAVDLFVTAVKREANGLFLQSGYLTAYVDGVLSTLLDADKKATVYVSTPQDRVVIALRSELEEMEPLTGKL